MWNTSSHGTDWLNKTWGLQSGNEILKGGRKNIGTFLALGSGSRCVSAHSYLIVWSFLRPLSRLKPLNVSAAG